MYAYMAPYAYPRRMKIEPARKEWMREQLKHFSNGCLQRNFTVRSLADLRSIHYRKESDSDKAMLGLFPPQ
eukprot:scaffold89861_cov47-Prasinocladus_malaysianus.AAC.1